MVVASLPGGMRGRFTKMGQVVGFVLKSELERLRLIREARAIYDSVFPAADAIGEWSDERDGKGDASAETAPSLHGKHPV
jgi:hypothetical protein